MNGEDRREGARFITELNVILRPSKGGEPLDDRATAHDVSVKGFKVESQSPLAENSLVAFTLELPRGGTASGKGRVVWSNRETFATWAGIEIVSMPWGDRRRLSALLDPETVDWERLASLLASLVMILTVLAAAHRVILSPSLRTLFMKMAPKIIALFLMGWALTGLLKKGRR